MILNRQRSVHVSPASLERFWQRARRRLGLPEDSLTICLVSEARMARWNCAYRGKRGPTDVLSFPAESRPDGMRGPSGSPGIGKTTEGGIGGKRFPGRDGQPEPGLYLGDIAIAPAVARRNSRRLGRGFVQELRILILHGALHLLGYDHETDRGEMQRLEFRLRRELGLDES
jgi:probable rRNA maturation factor